MEVILFRPFSFRPHFGRAGFRSVISNILTVHMCWKLTWTQIGVVSILKSCDLIHITTDCTRARDMPLLDSGDRIRKAEKSDSAPLAKRRRRQSSASKVGACQNLSKCIRYPMTEMQTSLVLSTKVRVVWLHNFCIACNSMIAKTRYVPIGKPWSQCD